MILCIGATSTLQRTMLFGRVEIDAVNRARAVFESAAGKSVNVARVLRALRLDALATGFLGGPSGALIRAELEAMGARTDFISVAPATRTCTTVIDESAGTATELVEESKPVGAGAWYSLLEKVSQLVVGAQVVVLSGTLTPDGPEDFFARCVRMARDAGAPTIVDARGPALRAALSERPTIIKPNRAELSATVDRPIDSRATLVAAMRAATDAGAEWVIVTDGKAPTFVTDGKRNWEISSLNVKTINPIGCGDSFAAGLAASLSRGQTVPQACITATACAASNAMNVQAGFVDREVVEKLCADVRVEEIG